jgi:hypothetical protein
LGSAILLAGPYELLAAKGKDHIRLKNSQSTFLAPQAQKGVVLQGPGQTPFFLFSASFYSR